MCVTKLDMQFSAVAAAAVFSCILVVFRTSKGHFVHPELFCNPWCEIEVLIFIRLTGKNSEDL